MTWSPYLEGGTWDWNEEYFSASFNIPATFTALKAGASTITYLINGLSRNVDVTVRESELVTGHDSMAMWLPPPAL